MARVLSAPFALSSLLLLSTTIYHKAQLRLLLPSLLLLCLERLHASLTCQPQLLLLLETTQVNMGTATNILFRQIKFHLLATATQLQLPYRLIQILHQCLPQLLVLQLQLQITLLTHSQRLYLSR